MGVEGEGARGTGTVKGKESAHISAAAAAYP